MHIEIRVIFQGKIKYVKITGYQTKLLPNLIAITSSRVATATTTKVLQLQYVTANIDLENGLLVPGFSLD